MVSDACSIDGCAKAVRACSHDTIASAAGIRVCFDCGELNPKRSKRGKRSSGAKPLNQPTSIEKVQDIGEAQ